jgi:predicted nucleic acid-binding protein
MGVLPGIFLTPFNRAELSVAIYRQVFLKRASTGEAQQALSDFDIDCQSGILNLIELPLQAWETTTDLARKFGPALGVRTLDTLHIACALELNAERFWTFDERQARLAEAVGLKTSA